jgi:hypothetical protein
VTVATESARPLLTLEMRPLAIPGHDPAFWPTLGDLYV